MHCNRRNFLSALSWPLALLLGTGSLRSSIAQEMSAEKEKQDWMDAIIGTKAFDQPTVLSKFLDGVFYLREPVVWRPSKQISLPTVSVPKGFVTDLASIPRLFWSAIPRDGQYADAAIVHDYLYWTQRVPKQVADNVFREAMKELEVWPVTVEALYLAVRSPFGDAAWDENRSLKNKGERRTLRVYPQSPAARWSEWKLVKENFESE